MKKRFTRNIHSQGRLVHAAGALVALAGAVFGFAAGAWPGFALLAREVSQPCGSSQPAA